MSAGVPRLEVRGLTKRFEGLTAVDGVGFAVAPGEIHGLIGPNGAGKTTLFNLVSGVLPPTTGTVALDGRALDGLPTWRRTRLGVARTFQNIRVFGAMSVVENVMTGMHARLGASLPAILSRRPSFREEERAAMARAREHLAFVGLAGAAEARAGDLPYGDQRRLEIARALAAEPRVLLLDEPAAGMNPAETTALLALLRRLRDEGGHTVLLVEHDVPLVMALCDRVTVVNFGQVIAEGTAREVRAHPAVIAAYLGTGDHSGAGGHLDDSGPDADAGSSA